VTRTSFGRGGSTVLDTFTGFESQKSGKYG
jgi:hypothetical protein